MTASPSAAHDHRYIVLGAGPGGLQMAAELDATGADFLVLEKEAQAATFFDRFPRHRRLISLNKRYNVFPEEEYNLRQDWNSLLTRDPALRFTEYSEELYPSADDLARYLRDVAATLAHHIAYCTLVTRISKDGDRFVLRTAAGAVYRCDVLLCALGTVGSYVPPEIEGIEHAIGYEEMSLEPDDYRGKRVAVIGQGNSAFETAEFLTPYAALVHVLAKRPPSLAWDTHFTGDVRAINNGIFELFHLKTMHAVLAPRLRVISRTGDTVRTSHEYDYPTAKVPGTVKLTREYDIMIRACGWRWVPEWLFDGAIQPETCRNGRFPALTPYWESVNVPNLYFVGGVMAANDRRSASGFIHGFRYNIRTLVRRLAERHEGTPHPVTRVEPFDWDEFADSLYKRLSITDALFALFGNLCDVLVVAADGSAAEVHRELPVGHVPDLDVGDGHMFVVTLEFGFHKHVDPAIGYLGPSDPNDPACGAFLHPIIRYRRRDESDEFHFGDSLLGRWDRSHGAGGAVTSYHVEFQRWGYEKLGLPTEGLPERGEGDFRPWSDDEIAAWHAAHTEVPEDESCENQLSTSARNRRRAGS